MLLTSTITHFLTDISQGVLSLIFPKVGAEVVKSLVIARKTAALIILNSLVMYNN